MLGDIYEYVLSKINSSGQVGMFRTPKQIRDMMVQLIRPQPMDTICDPACGTAGFLISSAEFIRDTYGNKMGDKEWEHYSKGLLTGFDTGSTMLKISAMNLLLHSIHEPHIAYQDSVSKNNEIEGQFDVILANPPFTGSVNKSTIAESLTNVCSTTKTELLLLPSLSECSKKAAAVHVSFRMEFCSVQVMLIKRYVKSWWKIISLQQLSVCQAEYLSLMPE